MPQIISICSKGKVTLGKSMCNSLGFGKPSILYANIFRHNSRTPGSEPLDLIICPFKFRDWGYLRQAKIKLQNIPNAMRHALDLLTIARLNSYGLRALDSAAGTVGLLDVILFPADDIENIPSIYPLTLRELDHYFIDTFALNPWLTKYIRPVRDRSYSIGEIKKSPFKNVERPWYLNYPLEFRRHELLKEQLETNYKGRFVQGRWCYSPEEYKALRIANVTARRNESVQLQLITDKTSSNFVLDIPNGIMDYVSYYYNAHSDRELNYIIVLTPNPNRRTLNINFIDPKEELFSLTMHIPDKVGLLAETASFLAESGINQRIVGNTFIEVGAMSEVNLLFDIGKANTNFKKMFYDKDIKKLTSILQTKINNQKISVKEIIHPLESYQPNSKLKFKKTHTSNLDNNRLRTEGSSEMSTGMQSDSNGINFGDLYHSTVYIDSTSHVESSIWYPLYKDVNGNTNLETLIERLNDDYFHKIEKIISVIEKSMQGNTSLLGDHPEEYKNGIVKLGEKVDALLGVINDNDELHDQLSPIRDFLKVPKVFGDTQLKIALTNFVIPFIRIEKNINLTELSKRIEEKAVLAFLEIQYQIERVVEKCINILSSNNMRDEK